jgi:cation:H+ antiporter
MDRKGRKMEIAISLIKIVIGFVLLIKGADFFVDGAASVAGKLGIPQIVIGLTIVAFGTSAPEAAISISSAVKHSNGISIGNVIGSNLMNILLILGLTAAIRTLNVKKTTVMIDIPFMIIASALLVIFGAFLGKLNFVVGIIFWVMLIGFITYLVIYSRKTDVSEDETEIKDLAPWKILLFIVGGIAAIIIGSDVTVDGATVVASALGVSDRIIGLTVVAFGTSLPELITSVTAARKGNADIAVGNIVGSNIFNILFVLGTSCLIITLPFSAAFVVDGVIALFAAILLWICVFKNKKLDRTGGIIMLICYAAYFVYLLL